MVYYGDVLDVLRRQLDIVMLFFLAAQPQNRVEKSIAIEWQ